MTEDLFLEIGPVLDRVEHIFREGLGVAPAVDKGDGDFATEVDVFIEGLLREELSRRTGIPVFGEETGGDSALLRAGRVWVVDPVDGTANFSAGNPLCSILLTLLEDGQPRLAVTSLPVFHHRVTAVAGGPLLRNGRPVVSRQETTQVGLSEVGPLAQALQGAFRPRITGSVGVNLSFCAQGVFCGAVSSSPNVWDNAAGVLLVQASGGIATAPDGSPWTPFSPGVVAGDRATHAVIIETSTKIQE